MLFPQDKFCTYYCYYYHHQQHHHYVTNACLSVPGRSMTCLQKVRKDAVPNHSQPGNRRRLVVSTMLRPLYPRVRTGTYCTGGWMDLWGGLVGAENLAHNGIQSPDRSAPSGYAIPGAVCLYKYEYIALLFHHTTALKLVHHGIPWHWLTLLRLYIVLSLHSVTHSLYASNTCLCFKVTGLHTWMVRGTRQLKTNLHFKDTNCYTFAYAFVMALQYNAFETNYISTQLVIEGFIWKYNGNMPWNLFWIENGIAYCGCSCYRTSRVTGVL
jgi:hypothetical protein